MTRILVIHPWMPQYRLAFMEQLKSKLAIDGIELVVAYGTPTKILAHRSDAVDIKDAIRINTHEMTVFAQNAVIFRNVFPLIRAVRPDAIVVEQAIKNAENWALLSRRMRLGAKLGFWGHGQSFSTSQSALASRLKAWLTGRGSWFFAYTPAGAHAVTESGYPSSRVTVVQNSTDTKQLSYSLSRITHQDRLNLRKSHRLVQGKTGLYIGGLDHSKGITWLLAAAREIAKREPEFRLLIIGDGILRERVHAEAYEFKHIVYLGAHFQNERAAYFDIADFLLIPQSIGLVAVDALASGRPIVTTTRRDHGPEAEYLSPGRTALFSDDNLASYADTVCRLMQDKQRHAWMVEQCILEGEKYSIESMVHNFAAGVKSWLYSV